MATRQTHSFNSSKLEPYLRPRDARTMACAMKPEVAVFFKGDRLAQITAAGATQGKWTHANLASNPVLTPTRLAVRDFVTDIDGIVYEGIEPYTTGPMASPNDTAMGYDRGYFLLSDLTTAMPDAEITAMKAEKIGVGPQTHIKLA